MTTYTEQSQPSDWSCSVCTFKNTSSPQICHICGQHRQCKDEYKYTIDEESKLKPKAKIRSNNEQNPQKSEDINKNVDAQIFRYNKYDIPIFGVLLIAGSIVLILGIFDILQIYYTLIAFIGYVISITMAVMLNADEIALKTKIKILATSYFIILTVLSVLSASFVNISMSGYITTTSLLSSWIIIIIMFCYEYGKNGTLASKVKYLLNIQALIVPVFVHFADIATDIGTTFEYYQRSQSDYDGSIEYDAIFSASVFILIFSRIVEAYIIWYHTRSIFDTILQFFDVYLIKTLGIEWKLNYRESGRVHQFIGLIEAIFESTPQSIISVYILIADSNKSVIVWLSSILSILSLSFRTISQDSRFFTAESHSKEHGWTTDDGAQCNKARCLFCNHPYLVRVIWRLIDVTSSILFFALFWYTWGPDWLLKMIVFEAAYMLFYVWLRFKTIGEVNIYWLNTLLTTHPSSWQSKQMEDVTACCFAVMRMLLHIGLMNEIYNKNQADALVLVNSCLMCVSCMFYIWFVGRGGCCGCYCCRCADNWVDVGVVTTLSIAGCNNIQEIRDLKQEGFAITHYLDTALTWKMYPRPSDLIQIAAELKHDLGAHRLYIYYIACNRRLDTSVSKEEMRTVVVYLKQFCDINEVLAWKTALEWAHINHSDKSWIQVFVEEGADFNPESIPESAAGNCIDCMSAMSN